MSKTAVGLFQNAGVANEVVHDLKSSAFPRREVRVLGESRDMPVTGVLSTPHTDFETGLDRQLRAVGASGPEASAYVRGVRRGGVLVFATGSTEAVDDAADVMNRHYAMKVEELTGQAPDTGGLTEETMAPIFDDSSQTGRVRQSGGGARMFVW
jgi:hypothetical protein